MTRGATDCLVPRKHLESIGLRPRTQRIYGLADGSEIRLDVTGGEIQFMGETHLGNHRIRKRTKPSRC